jgi:hypothetical protein
MTSPTRSALRRLGYEFIRPEKAKTEINPELRVVDERQIDEIPTVDAEPNMPIVMLTGVRPLTNTDRDADPRIIGRIARPAALTPLYGLLQQALESTPRRVPRVPTRLPARWIRQDHLATGAIVSLSEHGCLLSTGEEQRLAGARMEIQFALPGAGLLSMAAQCVHQRGSDMGLCFQEPSSSIRRAIGGFVSELLCAR